jgi:hypothetical protein
MNVGKKIASDTAILGTKPSQANILSHNSGTRKQNSIPKMLVSRDAWQNTLNFIHAIIKVLAKTAIQGHHVIYYMIIALHLKLSGQPSRPDVIKSANK